MNSTHQLQIDDNAKLSTSQGQFHQQDIIYSTRTRFARAKSTVQINANIGRTHDKKRHKNGGLLSNGNDAELPTHKLTKLGGSGEGKGQTSQTA